MHRVHCHAGNCRRGRVVTKGLAMKILIIDEPMVAELLTVCLQQTGYEVLRAANAEAAIRLVVEHKPGLIVMDPFGAETDGLGVLRQLRGELDMGGIPVIVLTRSSEKANVLQAAKIRGEELPA